MTSTRTATRADAAACLAIYRPFVESSAVSFEEVVPTVEEFAARIENALSAWTWKFDRWHDVAWFQRQLRETPG